MKPVLNKQPKLETLRRIYPDSNLSDTDLIELAEWVRTHLKLEHISPHNIVLNAIICYKKEK